MGRGMRAVTREEVCERLHEGRRYASGYTARGQPRDTDKLDLEVCIYVYVSYT